MFDFLKRIGLGTAIALMGVTGVRAFTLANGTNVNQVNSIGEEYRLNTPFLTYAFDESFLNFFGSKGVAAVEEAIGMLNAIPPVSEIGTDYPPASPKAFNLWNFPTRPDRYHPRAANLKLVDLKSHALAHLWKFMGLGSPEDDAYQYQFGDVVQRNYDPITYEPSRYVNGRLISWHFISPTNVVSFPVDLMEPVHTLAGVSWDTNSLSAGKFMVAPTRDDIGGLKYLYRRENFNVENLPPNTFQVVTNLPNVTNPAVYSVDLRWFCKESRTNTTTAFRAFVRTNQWWGPLYTNLVIPELLILETNVTWELGTVTNVTPYFTNMPWSVVGQPPVLKYETNILKRFQPKYDYVFGNVLTNIHVPAEESEVLYRSWEVVPKAKAWTVIGQSVGTVTNYTKTLLNDECPHGEILVLPYTNNLVGFHIGDLAYERVNTLTNLLTPTNNLAGTIGAGGIVGGVGAGAGGAGAVVTNFLGVMEDEVWQSTNHAYLAYPIVLQTNALILGGIEKVTFVKTEYESMITTNYANVNFDPEYPSFEDRTFTFLNYNTNNFPMFEFELEYVTNKVRKTSRFIRLVTRPDILFSAGEFPSTVLTVRTGPLAVNNNAINGVAVLGLFGPGVLQMPPVSTQMIFNKIGAHWAIDPNFFLNEENQGFGWSWGSFNGGTVDPIVYPLNRSIRDFERQIFSGGEGE